MVQCCAKSRKAMPGSGGQERAGKLATKIAKGAGGASLTIFVTDCRQRH